MSNDKIARFEVGRKYYVSLCKKDGTYIKTCKQSQDPRFCDDCGIYFSIPTAWCVDGNHVIFMTAACCYDGWTTVKDGVEVTQPEYRNLGYAFYTCVRACDVAD